MPSRKASRKASRKPKESRTSSRVERECHFPCRNKSCPLYKLAKDLLGKDRNINVRLSGSGAKLHFAGFHNKGEVEDYLRDKFKRFHFTFVKTKEAQFIVIPNEASNASDSALGESRACVWTISAFTRLLRHV